MFTRIRKCVQWSVLPIFLLGFAGFSMALHTEGANPEESNNHPPDLTEQVRCELVKLPFLGMFDDLSFKIEDSSAVVLTGQVVRPTLKSSAETAISRIPGITNVVNNIEVLPLSPYDDSIRLRTYRAIFSQLGFEKYAIQSLSPIRIIVKNGNITLEGTVGNRLDKTIAKNAARTVHGAFSVTDNLTIG